MTKRSMKRSCIFTHFNQWVQKRRLIWEKGSYHQSRCSSPDFWLGLSEVVDVLVGVVEGEMCIPSVEMSGSSYTENRGCLWRRLSVRASCSALAMLTGVIFIKLVAGDRIDCSWFSLLLGTEGVNVEKILRSTVAGSEEVRLKGEICMPETVRWWDGGRSYRRSHVIFKSFQTKLFVIFTRHTRTCDNGAGLGKILKRSVLLEFVGVVTLWAAKERSFVVDIVFVFVFDCVWEDSWRAFSFWLVGWEKDWKGCVVFDGELAEDCRLCSEVSLVMLSSFLDWVVNSGWCCGCDCSWVTLWSEDWTGNSRLNS